MEITHANSILRVHANSCVEKTAPVLRTEPVVRSTVGVQRAVKIDFEDATVQRVSVEADNAHVLLLIVNVTLMFVAIAGLVVVGVL